MGETDRDNSAVSVQDMEKTINDLIWRIERQLTEKRGMTYATNNGLRYTTGTMALRVARNVLRRELEEMTND